MEKEVEYTAVFRISNVQSTGKQAFLSKGNVARAHGCSYSQETRKYKDARENQRRQETLAGASGVRL